MSLDKNLFTLFITPNKDDPNVVDLVDNSINPVTHYRKHRLPGQVYKIEVYDPLSESLLITATAPSATSKHKTLELSNPTTIVELKYTGTLSFKWAFKWEEHDFEWKREECFLLRKPDPPVLIAVTKVAAGRLKTASVQLLDYNLNRFDIDDRKGLEIVVLTALLTFQDANDQYHLQREDSTPSAPATNVTPNITRRVSDKGPTPPPKPAPRTGVERIVEMQAAKGEYNEIVVETEGNVDDYAQYCSNLLQDDALLFVTLRSEAAEHVPKVLQVVEETKRIRHKAGLEDQELYQYVLYDTAATGQKGPRRINLDDDKGKPKAYTPPNNLSVHLSKIPMPELQPKPSIHDKHYKDNKVDGKGKKEDKDKGKKKEDRRASPSPQSTPSSQHVLPHQVHPKQPSPSPSQLNNPAIYVAPPPQQPRPIPFLQLPRPWSRGTSEPEPGLYPAALQPMSNQPTPGWVPPPPPQSSAQQPSTSRPVTPSGVVSGLFDMLHIR